MRAGAILRVQPGRVVSEFIRGRALSKLSREQQHETANQPRPWLDSDRAVICAEQSCRAVYVADGGACPRCGSFPAVPIARALDPAPKPDDEGRVS